MLRRVMAGMKLDCVEGANQVDCDKTGEKALEPGDGNSKCNGPGHDECPGPQVMAGM
jgi:hypothetical protein